MATVSKFTSTAKIFDKASRSQSFKNLVSREAKEFKQKTRTNMIEGNPSGRLYERKRGSTFRRSHRASRIGQRPAVDTGTLAQAISDKTTGNYSAEVYIAEKVNPRDGTISSEYGDILQNDLGRPIMSPGDAFQAEHKMKDDAERLVATLV